MARGTLVLVVGPSGAGKDSIITGAANCLREDARFLFAQRLITRAAGAGGENHVGVSPADFAARRLRGELMLHWRAHGLDYGLPRDLAAALEQGHSVVANVSRTVVDEARQRFAPVLVVAIHASPETLATRLAARGRENPAQIERRLERAGVPALETDFDIDNDGPIEIAVDAFVTMLCDLTRQTASAPASR